jgi:hypothetical protein
MLQTWRLRRREPRRSFVPSSANANGPGWTRTSGLAERGHAERRGLRVHAEIGPSQSQRLERGVGTRPNRPLRGKGPFTPCRPLVSARTATAASERLRRPGGQRLLPGAKTAPSGTGRPRARRGRGRIAVGRTSRSSRPSRRGDGVQITNHAVILDREVAGERRGRRIPVQRKSVRQS